VTIAMRGVAAVVALGMAACVPPPVTYRLPGSVFTPIGMAAVKDGRARFGEIFCTTLTQDPDLDTPPVSWDPCAAYIENPAAPTALAPLSTTYGVLIVSGIFSECIESQGVFAFEQGRHHLESRHGLTTGYVPVSGMGSSEANATQIEQYIAQHPGKWIAVGYSKGASDLMVALQRSQLVRDNIKALVTVAGTVGGSRLADILDQKLGSWVQGVARTVGFPGCHVADAGGIESLRRPTRQHFLSEYSATTPAFSIVGVSTLDKTSRVLQPTWKWLQTYSSDQDSQVISEEGTVPGGTFLGVARADHWAIALPFWERHNARTDVQVNWNKFPRTALLESIVRFVIGSGQLPPA
jgi:hypothetical protein